jgi:hypothetical protein
LDKATALMIEVAVVEVGASAQQAAGSCGLRWQWMVQDSAFLNVKAVIVECIETNLCYAGGTALDNTHCQREGVPVVMDRNGGDQLIWRDLKMK